MALLVTRLVETGVGTDFDAKVGTDGGPDVGKAVCV